MFPDFTQCLYTIARMVLLIIKILLLFETLPTQLSPTILILDGAQNDTLSAS